ncbi:uncharacterized protein LOC119369355 [Jatropha curcas]|uniref:uncharacterized protein LOC119369355 n=1 Tax=Jatropha curcas TaxID=180498 RepID=UPI001895B92D|nr:uncharacterized protein LOC119369355 [Jatropha curcas]
MTFFTPWVHGIQWFFDYQYVPENPDFGIQKAKCQARLAAAKTPEEYKLICEEMFQLLSTSSDPQVKPSSSKIHAASSSQSSTKTAHKSKGKTSSSSSSDTSSSSSEDSDEALSVIKIKTHYDLELHQWNIKRQPFLIGDFRGVKKTLLDWCILYEACSGSKSHYVESIMLVLYVDDILLAANDVGLLHDVKDFLSKNFDMKDMGEASFVIRIEIFRDRSQGLLGSS